MADAWRRDLRCEVAAAADWVVAVGEADIHVLQAQAWETGPSWSIPRRRLPDTWFFMAESGRLTVDVAKRSFRLEPGGLMLVPEGVEHAVVYAERRRGRMLSVHATCLTADGEQLLDAYGGGVLRLARDWLRRWRRLVASRQVGMSGIDEQAGGLLRQMLVELGCEHALPPPRRQEVADRRVRKALHRMRARPWENVTEHAAALGLSPGRLRVLFGEQFGRSPIAALRDLRLGLALRLLREEGGLSLAAIARRCGYASQQYFHQDFRRRMGCPPGRWRERQVPV